MSRAELVMPGTGRPVFSGRASRARRFPGPQCGRVGQSVQTTGKLKGILNNVSNPVAISMRSGCASMHLLDEAAMFYVLHNWIFVGSRAYDEYTFIPWLNKNVYRRTVDLSRVCML